MAIQDLQSHSPPLSSMAKGCAPPEYMLKSLPCCADHAPPDCRQDLQKKMFFKKNDDLYIIKYLPITKRLNTYIHHSTKWGSSTQPSGDTSEIYIWQLDTLHLHPRQSGETKIGRYMTFDTIKEVHDIETKYLEQYLWKSPITDSSSICQSPFISATMISFYSSSAFVLLETNNRCELEPKASKIMPTMHH